MTYYTDRRRHLICVPYSKENLHKMAEDLGIKRCWYHAHPRYPHYDIPKTRIEEIEAKCEIVSTVELISLMRKQQNDLFSS